MTIASMEAANPLERGEFRGNAREYFGIWIVNVLLTIVTLGIYSAWAKVRRNRYFYGNSVVAGHSFDYHARGKQIFIGRAIVFAIFITIQIVAAFYPLFGIVVPFILLAVLPWLISRGLRFSARVTSYRNIRFDFVGTGWRAFLSILLGGILAFLSFGILAPLASRWLYRYMLNNLRYGDRAFSTDPKLGPLYRVWVLPALMVLVGLVLAALAGWMVYSFDQASDPDVMLDETQLQLRIIGTIYAAMIALFIMYAVAGIFYRVGVRNVVMNATLLDGKHTLFSDLSRGRYFWIVLSNLIVMVLTLGLMRPWAAVREQRYVVEHTGIVFMGDLDDIMASIQATGTAATAEYLDMEGFDFGF
ncbi:DUF898 domain-containing protein [Agrobacterium sp. a22-2]|uniref:YjgN family protein n=1 Tax=Agrobacterium sp. a22-2 TaxID=2283840 RepID=UPI0014459012|nr:YjgN family protein [Agrobacterium sp. a22-2]NKN38671.1 DUF898 domain-containing protein [Agrobacterium sp. a22-2]